MQAGEATICVALLGAKQLYWCLSIGFGTEFAKTKTRWVELQQEREAQQPLKLQLIF